MELSRRKVPVYVSILFSSQFRSETTISLKSFFYPPVKSLQIEFGMQEEKSCTIFIEQTLTQSLCALTEERFNVGVTLNYYMKNINILIINIKIITI